MMSKSLPKGLVSGWLLQLALLACAWSSAHRTEAQSLLVRLGDGGQDNGAIGSVAAAGLSPRRTVTAVRTAEGDLRLAVWDIDDRGGVVGKGVGTAGAILDAAVVGLGPRRVASVVRQGDGKLAIITWRIDADGKVEREGKAVAGVVGRIDAAAIGTAWLITAVETESHTLKLISWRVWNSGDLERRGEAEAGQISDLSIATYGYRQLVTAVRQGNGTLKLINWTMDSSGGFIRLGSATGPAVTMTRVAMGAADRAVTASRRDDGTLQVAAWDLDLESGAVAPGGSAGAGAVSGIAVAPLGGIKILTAVRDSGGRLKLISWQVVEGVERLDDALAGPADLLSAAPLFVGNEDRESGAAVSWDRVVTAVRQADGSLKVIPWVDRAVGMLRSSWGPEPKLKVGQLPPAIVKLIESDAAASPAEGYSGLARIGRGILARARPEIGPEMERRAGSQSPPWSVRFEPGVEGVDPMVAVGEKFLIVSQQGWIKFFDKQGNALTGSGGFPASLSATEFFGGFVAPRNDDGTVNRSNVNLYLRFPPTTDPILHCYAMKESPTVPCITSFYDTRVAYDPYRKRFLVLSAARHPGYAFRATSDPSARFHPIVRRYFALAVSNSEDPRDGFRQYMSTEGNYADWPRMATSDGHLVVAHNAGKAADDLRPMGYVFALDDLTGGGAAPRNWKIAAAAVGGGTLYPVIHSGEAGGRTYLVQPRETGVDIHSFAAGPGIWEQPPALDKTTAALGARLVGFREGVHFRGGRLYLASAVKISDRVPDQAPTRYSVRVLRIPLAPGAGGAPAVQPGIYDLVFGRNALEDDPEDLVSYEVPSIAVNKNGDMLVVYGRVPVSTAQPLFQEARYSVIYSDERGLQRSRLLQEGEFLHTTVQKGESQATAVTYYRHSWDKAADKDWIDYGNAVVDPQDDLSFWMAHEFAGQENTAFKLVVGKVTP